MHENGFSQSKHDPLHDFLIGLGGRREIAPFAARLRPLRRCSHLAGRRSRSTTGTVATPHACIARSTYAVAMVRLPRTDRGYASRKLIGWLTSVAMMPPAFLAGMTQPLPTFTSRSPGDRPP